MDEKVEEKSNEENCKAYEIGCIKDLGNFLIAKKKIEAGDVILVDSPVISGPKCTKDEYICVGCCKTIEDENQRCPVCGWPLCRADCPSLAAHSGECQILKLCPTKAGEYFSYDILMILRCLLLQTTHKDKWGVIISWDDHLQYKNTDKDFLTKIQEKCTFIEEIYIKPLKAQEKNSGKPLLPRASKDVIQKVCAILDKNLMECDNRQILYPVASLLEHNCLPNSLQFIKEQNHYQLTVKAVTTISKGEHINLSYTNILVGTQERRRHLKELKNISCSCPRCIDPTELNTFISAMICFGTEEDACKGVQLPQNPTDDNPKWICNKCDIQLPNNDVSRFVQHLSNEVNKVIKKNPSYDEMKDFMGKLQLFLHDNHYLVNKVKYHLIQLQENGDTVDRLKWCEELLEIVRKIDPYRVRLGLYVSTILTEQFDRKRDLLMQSFSPNQKEKSLTLIKELWNILKENKDLLTFLCKFNDVESRVKENSKNEVELRDWLMEQSISIDFN